MQKKRRINRAWNCYIEPRCTDIDHVERQRIDRIKLSRHRRRRVNA